MGKSEVNNKLIKNMTPISQDYSPGLGDRMDSVSYTIGFGWLGLPSAFDITTTYDQALEIQEQISNLLNGIHQVPYVIGQDKLRWGTSPYLIEDICEPMGDNTPGSGYRKYREFVDASFKYNSDISQIIEPLLAGQRRNEVAVGDEIIPPSCYTHTEDGKTKLGWGNEEAGWDLLSLYNLYECGYAQKAWKRMQDNWNFRTHLYYDAMIPVPEGFYNNPNLTTEFGGVITDTEMEWDAVQRETKYSWENYAISSGQEHIHPKYKGLSVYFSMPYGYVSDDDYLNMWGNSVLICTRTNEGANLAWGSEIGTEHADAFQFNGENRPWDAFITRMFEHNLQYLYMMERKPESYTNNDDIYQVVFSGNLVSTFDKKTGYYTLVENGNLIIADGTDRFIPQVGAGCKIYAYSRDGKNRKWLLPEMWNGIDKVDVYTLSVDSTPVKTNTLDVVNNYVTIDMESRVPYLIVPYGDTPTPKTANFNDLIPNDNVCKYQELVFDLQGNPQIKVYEASSKGGFGSPSIYADCNDEITSFKIGMKEGTILHSLKVGNKGGTGKVVLHSSNPQNQDVMIFLPKTDCVYKFNTQWKYPEFDEIVAKVENDNGVNNVLFDAIVYSPSSR